MTDRLETNEINRLAKALGGACNAWREKHGAVEAGLHVDMDKRDLDQLVDAAGLFRGMANRLRAT